ncbi:MAG: hypothetical protein WDO13_05695 [Verrucomicrobiota bacterium]
MLGRVPQQRLLDAATVPDAHQTRHRRCQAWFYIGLKALADGDQPGAAAAFKTCVTYSQIRLAEHEFASVKLQEWGATAQP